MIDSHCHLADAAFAADLDAVVERAKTAGLRQALVILEGGNNDEAVRAQRVAALWPDVRFAVGIHPHIAGHYGDDPARTSDVVRTQIDRTSGTVAVGEIGLDYHYNHAPRDVQQQVFRTQ